MLTALRSMKTAQGVIRKGQDFDPPNPEYYVKKGLAETAKAKPSAKKPEKKS